MADSQERRLHSPTACCDAHSPPGHAPECGRSHTPAPVAGSSCEHAARAASPTGMPSASASATAGSPPADDRPPSELERAVRTIQKGAGTSAEKSAAIHSLFAAQRARAAASAVRSRAASQAGVFPGAGAPRGCEHYQRNCWIKAACCGRYYACRRCHDAAEGHPIDRTATRFVACAVCGDADQPVAASCRTCGVRFARYFCATCKFYDDSPTNSVYHCDACGMCRRGRREDFKHCAKCNTCLPIANYDDHPCRERNLDCNCPICGEFLGTSTEQAIFLACGHPIHEGCLKRHMSTSYTCPICSKCIPPKEQMEPWYRKLDERLLLDRMPPELANRVSHILCNDCEVKSEARFHFQFHRCEKCKGYNTRVLAQYDVDPKDLPPPLAACMAAEAGSSAMAQATEADAPGEPPPATAAPAESPPADAAEPSVGDDVCKPARQASSPPGPVAPAKGAAAAETGGSAVSSPKVATPDSCEQLTAAAETAGMEKDLRQSSPCPVAEATR